MQRRGRPPGVALATSCWGGGDHGPGLAHDPLRPRPPGLGASEALPPPEVSRILRPPTPCAATARSPARPRGRGLREGRLHRSTGPDTPRAGRAASAGRTMGRCAPAGRGACGRGRRTHRSATERAARGAAAPIRQHSQPCGPPPRGPQPARSCRSACASAKSRTVRAHPRSARGVRRARCDWLNSCSRSVVARPGGGPDRPDAGPSLPGGAKPSTASGPAARSRPAGSSPDCRAEGCTARTRGLHLRGPPLPIGVPLQPTAIPSVVRKAGWQRDPARLRLPNPGRGGDAQVPAHHFVTRGQSHQRLAGQRQLGVVAHLGTVDLAQDTHELDRPRERVLDHAPMRGVVRSRAATVPNPNGQHQALPAHLVPAQGICPGGTGRVRNGNALVFCPAQAAQPPVPRRQARLAPAMAHPIKGGREGPSRQPPARSRCLRWCPISPWAREATNGNRS